MPKLLVFVEKYCKLWYNYFMSKTPLNDMLNKYASQGAIRLHMPAHKGLIEGWQTDVTELSFTDDLRNPQSVIADSQRLYASKVGAKYCHYLVNGSTAGLFAMAGCVDTCALVESNCHVSLTNGLQLFGKQSVVVEASLVDDIPQPLTLEQIKTALNANPQIDAVFVTSPNYFGQTANLKEIYKFLHKKGVKLFVDSAHGAHFGFSPLLPANACKWCDAAVESTHKTLGALTQTAVLLCNDEKLSQSLKTVLNLTTTTSPSFVLIASIERAMDFLAREGKARYDNLHKEVQRFSTNASLGGWSVLQTDDFTRLVIDCHSKGYNAKAVYNALEKQGVYCEFATNRYVVAILSAYDDGMALDVLATALHKVCQPKNLTEFNYVERCFSNTTEKL